MTQHKSISLLESCMNVGSGFILSLVVWEVVIEPLFGIEKSLRDNIGITGIFTAISIVRGYIWRRLFNK